MLLINHYLFPTTCYLLLVTYYLLLVSSYFLFLTSYLLLITQDEKEREKEDGVCKENKNPTNDVGKNHVNEKQTPGVLAERARIGYLLI